MSVFRKTVTALAGDLWGALIWAAIPLMAAAYFSDFTYSPTASSIMILAALAFGGAVVACLQRTSTVHPTPSSGMNDAAEHKLIIDTTANGMRCDWLHDQLAAGHPGGQVGLSQAAAIEAIALRREVPMDEEIPLSNEHTWTFGSQRQKEK